IDGIFFDEMSNDLALVGYYQALRDHVASRSATARTIGNPGTPFTFDSSNGASGHDVDDYAAVFDTLMTFESDVTEYLNAYVAPTWAERVDASRFAHVVHSVTSDADSKQALTLSKQRKAGFVYLTHDVMPNPYDELSSRFADERARLLAANQAPPGQAVPIPGLALLAGLLGLLGGLLARARGARPGHGP
ncbi:MAG: hypothetical protein KDK91_10715, partial [Gammaproteobacteria bacterium]|nr:hypothetical protein [Gammaproteobacteria bacterium]